MTHARSYGAAGTSRRSHQGVSVRLYRDPRAVADLRPDAWPPAAHVHGRQWV